MLAAPAQISPGELRPPVNAICLDPVLGVHASRVKTLHSCEPLPFGTPDGQGG